MMDQVERFKEAFEYHEDGYLLWKIAASTKTRIGSRAGSLGKVYWRVKLDGHEWYIHQVVFAIHHGCTPDQVDHWDRNKRNNKFGNLHDATRSENQRNRGPTRRNVTGVKGVVPSPTKGKFTARRNGVRYGTFNNIEEAAKAVEGR